MTRTPNRLLNFDAVFLIQPKVSSQSSVMHLEPILFVFVAEQNFVYRKWHFMRPEWIQCWPDSVLSVNILKTLVKLVSFQATSGMKLDRKYVENISTCNGLKCSLEIKCPTWNNTRYWTTVSCKSFNLHFEIQICRIIGSLEIHFKSEIQKSETIATFLSHFISHVIHWNTRWPKL